MAPNNPSGWLIDHPVVKILFLKSTRNLTPAHGTRHARLVFPLDRSQTRRPAELEELDESQQDRFAECLSLCLSGPDSVNHVTNFYLWLSASGHVFLSPRPPPSFYDLSSQRLPPPVDNTHSLLLSSTTIVISVTVNGGCAPMYTSAWCDGGTWEG